MSGAYKYFSDIVQARALPDPDWVGVMSYKFGLSTPHSLWSISVNGPYGTNSC